MPLTNFYVKKCFINAVNMELGESVFSYVDIS